MPRPPVPVAPTPRHRALRPLVVAGVAVVAVLVVLALWRPWSDDTSPASVSQDQAVGETPLQLGPDGSPDATFVEFLDFQCPACAAVKPAIDEARAEFEGDATFVVRMFPLDVHPNAVPSAQAALAADAQGEFEGMYDLLFAGQTEWASLQDPRPVFQGYAETLGLDLAQFDEDYEDQATLDRIEADRQAALDLGLTSTPSFVLDGEVLDPESYADLSEALREAVGS
ncbi:thioredoxin domain-containing protein [uncultured Serinicoccus sp.]|uniref:DsbA family protein n=1 Tax=uncultured Serinicoccus sp. TaxID=735514 RepID=UPI00262F372D|nr:thioredoxin domain-containing protein [uncultured Serinicoccus sp.]